MYKALLVYSGFTIAFLLVVAAFITATTYLQLAGAVVSYPVLIFFAYKIFRRRFPKENSKENAVLQPFVESTEATGGVEEINSENSVVADINKRTFLKIVGATGISFFLISIFGRSIQSLLFGQNFASTQSEIGNSPSGNTGTAMTSPTDGYKISEVDDDVVSYYGFINKSGDWFIMKGDSATGAFRYSKGSLNFSENWKNRKNLKYDYFDKIFS